MSAESYCILMQREPPDRRLAMLPVPIAELRRERPARLLEKARASLPRDAALIGIGSSRDEQEGLLLLHSRRFAAVDREQPYPRIGKIENAQ